MTKRMLIDATHAEETRVVVLDGNRLEDFDVETSTKRQLKGNIYLAKVVRVEPSLQAAFVEYGGNRHGFLAFSEIHPDYYQIPVADRQRLIEMQAEEARREEEEEDRAAEAAESGTVAEPVRISDVGSDDGVPEEIHDTEDDAQATDTHTDEPFEYQPAQPASIASESVAEPFEHHEPTADTPSVDAEHVPATLHGDDARHDDAPHHDALHDDAPTEAVVEVFEAGYSAEAEASIEAACDTV